MGWSQQGSPSIASEGRVFWLTLYFLPSLTISFTGSKSLSFILNRPRREEKVARSRLFWLLGLFFRVAERCSVFESFNFITFHWWNRKKLSFRGDPRIKIGRLKSFLTGLWISDSYNCTTAIRDSAVSTVHPRSSVFLGRRGSLINERHWIQPARISGQNRCENLVKISRRQEMGQGCWLVSIGWLWKDAKSSLFTE